MIYLFLFVFSIRGSNVLCEVKITLTDAGTGSGGLFFTLPVNQEAITTTSSVFTGRENASTGKMLQGFWQSTSTVAILDYANNGIITTGYNIIMSGVYIIA